MPAANVSVAASAARVVKTPALEPRITMRSGSTRPSATNCRAA
jgi:hypothetical protein